MNQKPDDCKHTDQTDIVVDSTTTTEEIWTVCDNCSLVTNKRFES
jgi:hypothetical protein